MIIGFPRGGPRVAPFFWDFDKNAAEAGTSSAEGAVLRYDPLMAPILKLREDDEERELDFEIDYLLSLTVEQRTNMMLEESERTLRSLIAHGQRKPVEVVKRPRG